MMKWTIGMPSYNNYVEVFFTVQALRLYHDLKDCEIVVIDNFGDDNLCNFIKKNGCGIVRYDRYTDITGVSAAKNRIFEIAKGEFVLCIDSHILIKPGFTDIEIKNNDFHQGALLSSGGKNYACEWLPEWRSNMWGIWAPMRTELPSNPWEIWAQGAGFFACRKDSWLGFNKNFRGFGGETGYIQEKYRKAGNKVWCNPKMIWQHLFNNDRGKCPYKLDIKDRIRNYVYGFEELGLDTKPIYEHFRTTREKVFQ